MWPSCSSALRIAPMRPSIMSLGATMSTPAAACDKRLLHQRFDGLVVDDVAAVVDQAVLAVRGVGIERDVGDHAEFGEARLQRADRALAPGRRRPTPQRRRATSPPARSPGTARAPECAIRRPARRRAAARRSTRVRRRASTPPRRGRRARARTPDRSGRWPVSTVSRIRRRENVVAAHAARADVGIGHGAALYACRENGPQAVKKAGAIAGAGEEQTDLSRQGQGLTAHCFTCATCGRREQAGRAEAFCTNNMQRR